LTKNRNYITLENAPAKTNMFVDQLHVPRFIS